MVSAQPRRMDHPQTTKLRNRHQRASHNPRPALERPHTAPHYRRSPVTTISVARLPHREQTSRFCHSATGVSGPYRRAISAGSDEAPDDEPNTGSRRAPSLIGGPGVGFHLTASAVSSTTPTASDRRQFWSSHESVGQGLPSLGRRRGRRSRRRPDLVGVLARSECHTRNSSGPQFRNRLKDPASWPSQAGPTVRRLTAGGNEIRTGGPAAMDSATE
jgi:hypothetical protein